MTEQELEILIAKDNIKTRLAANINYIRGQLEFTQQQMADVLKITRPTFGAIEEGRSRASLETIVRLSNYAKVSLETLILTDMNIDGEKYAGMRGRPWDKKENPLLP